MNIKQLDARDNVAVLLEDTPSIPRGHKVALCDMKAGDFVIKYGAVIGRATADIKKGEHVHSHNLRSHLDEEESYEYRPAFSPLEVREGTFLGYKRESRRAGIRNEIYIIPTVGCVNAVADALAKEANALKKGSIDGIYALTHPFGCSQLGEDGENITKFLSAIAQNPNATYCLIVGLGCENNTMEAMKKALQGKDDHIRYLVCQQVEDEHAVGMAILREMIDKAATLNRESVPLSELAIGLKCGGSDAFSGIVANPLVGMLSERFLSLGASAVLTEVPEMFGAEKELMARCIDGEIFEKYRKMIVDFKNYYIQNGFPVYENPSPGNKAGGITTLEEKSLGCIRKGGSAPVVDVLGYTEPVTKIGLSVLDAPGNDLVASTALGASGCQIVLFTTGRGTPFSTFVPTVKIASNHPLATFKSNWIDFDASPMDVERFFDYILAVIEGREVLHSEFNREIAFYKKGVTL